MEDDELDDNTLFLMTGVGAFYDATGAGLNLIPVLGTILAVFNDIVADATFWLWFKIKGKKYSKGMALGSYLIKLVPFLDILPTYTAMGVGQYLQKRARKAAAIIPGGETAAKTLDKAA